MRNHFLRAGGVPSSGDGVSAYVEGKFHCYKSSTTGSGGNRDDGGFGAFWDNGTTIEDLQIDPDGDAAAFYEETDSTNTGYSDEWISFEIDLSSVTSPGRLVFYARRDEGDDFCNDFSFDSIKLNTGNGSVVDFSTSVAATISNNLWYRAPASDFYTDITNYSTAKSNYDSNDLESMGSTETTTHKQFNLGKITTGSQGTGPDKASTNEDDDFYIHFEASGTSDGGGGNYVAWKDRYNLTTGAAV